MRFVVSTHSIRPGVQVVEVLGEHGELLATLTPGDVPGELRMVSKHVEDLELDDVYGFSGRPGMLKIFLRAMP